MAVLPPPYVTDRVKYFNASPMKYIFYAFIPPSACDKMSWKIARKVCGFVNGSITSANTSLLQYRRLQCSNPYTSRGLRYARWVETYLPVNPGVDPVIFLTMDNASCNSCLSFINISGNSPNRNCFREFKYILYALPFFILRILMFSLIGFITLIPILIGSCWECITAEAYQKKRIAIDFNYWISIHILPTLLPVIKWRRKYNNL
jgi:hypothetical protein